MLAMQEENIGTGLHFPALHLSSYYRRKYEEAGFHPRDLKDPGEFRRIQNWIGPPGCSLNEATYVPPPVVEMQEALDAFEKFLYASSALPPLVRLGLLHYQFEAIHPFIDGNKRAGHAAMEVFLTLNGYEIEASVDEQESVILQVASGEMGREAFTHWLHIHIRSLP